MNKPSPRRQKPVKGGRQRLNAAVIHAINRKVEAQARFFNVSKSFVITVALAEQFGVPLEDVYR